MKWHPVACYMVTNFLEEPASSLFISLTLKLEAADLFEKLIPLYRATQCHIPQNHNLNIHNHVKISSHIFQVIFMLKFLYKHIFICILYMPVWCYLSNVHTMLFLFLQNKVVHVVGMYTEDLQLTQVVTHLTLNTHCTSHRYFFFSFLFVWVHNETNQY